MNSVFRGQDCILYLDPLMWQLIPSEFKEFNTASAFKAAIRKWKPNNCPCRLCKTYWKCWNYLSCLFGVNKRRRVFGVDNKDMRTSFWHPYC